MDVLDFGVIGVDPRNPALIEAHGGGGYGLEAAICAA
jgi:hypothetical protein